VSPPPSYDAERVRRVRAGLNVSQPVFAGMLNVSNSTVQAWEQGVREPDGASLRLLEIAENHPGALLASVSQPEGTGARRRKRG
jgi:putative transcriptional regulator